MATKAEDIAQLLRQEGSAANKDGSLTAEVKRQNRAELLIPVLATCQEAWTSKSEEMSFIAEKLADGSRDAAWRGPLGDSGILEFFLGVLASGQLAQVLQVQILRLVGNSCADTDENRGRIVEGDHLKLIIDHLQYESLIPFCVPVLYNIMVDYEPAQLLASKSHLNQHLTKILTSAGLSKFAVFVPYICKTLALLITQDCEPALADPNTVTILLNLAIAGPPSDDLDDFITTVSVALSYLVDEGFQERMTAEPQMKIFMSAFHYAHTHFDLKKDDHDEETAQQFKNLKSGLLVALADITGHDGFASLHSSEGEVARTLLAWLDGPDAQLQAASCLALGNLSRSDETSISLVERHRAHVPITKLLSDPTIGDAQTLHSALSFMKNLAVASQNKPHLSKLLDLPCVPRLLNIDSSPQIQFSAMSLIRLLLVGCPANAVRICLSPVSSAEEPPCIDRILGLYKRSDAEPTRLEAARAVASIFRSFHTPQSGSKTASRPVENGENDTNKEYIKEREYLSSKVAEIANTLSLLVTQEKWPILCSEAWFVFALMCRSEDGAEVVAKVLDIQGAKEALYQAITGRKMTEDEDNDDTQKSIKQIEEESSAGDDQLTTSLDGLELEPKQADPKAKESFARVNRENALVMCTEILRTWAGETADPRPEMSPWLRELVREGTELVVAQKAEEETEK